MLKDYYSDKSRNLDSESKKIREYFKTHKPTAGANRETLIAQFLKENLPSRFEISSGLIMSKEGQFSNQADIVICDRLNNAPLFPIFDEPIWLVESVYSLIEVKTSLSPSTLKDSIEKCMRFKNLKRDFNTLMNQKITDSLFVLWSFEAPSPQTIKENIEKLFSEIPLENRPDLIIVPGSIICKSGTYFKTVKIGQDKSPYRMKILQENNGRFEHLLEEGFEIFALNENTVLAFIVWISSWLNAAGFRSAPLQNYLGINDFLGYKV